MYSVAVTAAQCSDSWRGVRIPKRSVLVPSFIDGFDMVSPIVRYWLNAFFFRDVDYLAVLELQG